jgi:LemA protein
MRALLIVLAVFVALLAIAGGLVWWAFVARNTCVTLDEGAERTLGDVDAQLQRRNDLVPNLVNAVKGSMGFENKTLKEVIEARSKVSQLNISFKDATLNAEKMKEFAAAQSQLGGALSRLMAVVESYPDLKSAVTVRDLMTQLEGTENRISVARQRYNEAIVEPNVWVRSPIGGIIANWADLKHRTRFEADKEAKTAPTVNLDFTK